MKNRRIRNPLTKRIPRELLGDWKKYLLVSFFLILTIGFVSGMYVANGSMMQAAREGVTKYRLENGHFELSQKADQTLLAAIQSGEKADIRQYFSDRAREELDDKFEEEFERKFTEVFDSEFRTEFDMAFDEQIKQSLLAQGLDEAAADAMLPGTLEQMREFGDYQAAYDAAYEEAYARAYDETYESAYEEAWEEIQKEIEEKYAEAEERYELNTTDFKAVPVRVFENFYRNQEEDGDNDGVADGTIRVYVKTQEVNLACLMEGRFPETEEEIAVDRMHADNVGIAVGDIIKKT